LQLHVYDVRFVKPNSNENIDIGWFDIFNGVQTQNLQTICVNELNLMFVTIYKTKEM